MISFFDETPLSICRITPDYKEAMLSGILHKFVPNGQQALVKVFRDILRPETLNKKEH